MQDQPRAVRARRRKRESPGGTSTAKFHARFRRPHRQDARTARFLANALGALQARRQLRPCPHRRGARHQPRPVEHRRTADRRNFLLPRALAENRTTSAFAVRRGRRETIDLQLPRCRPLPLHRRARTLSQTRERSRHALRRADPRGLLSQPRPRLGGGRPNLQRSDHAGKLASTRPPSPRARQAKHPKPLAPQGAP